MYNINKGKMTMGQFVSLCKLQACLHSNKFILINGRPATDNQIKDFVASSLAKKTRFSYSEHDKCINLIIKRKEGDKC